MTEFKCTACDKVFYSEEALQQHNVAKHGKGEEVRVAGKNGNKTKYILGIVVVLIIVGIYFVMTAKGTEYEIKTPDEDHVLGDANAAVTITEFSDFQCPFCAKFNKETKPQIESYIENGTAKLIFKHYLLPAHSNAQKAAEAVECAADIGGGDAFWQMHDKMFQNNNFLSISNLKRFASEIGLNTTDFNNCLDSGVMRIRVQKDMDEGKQLGVTATPAFFVAGKNETQNIVGAQPFSVFKAAIESKM